VRALGTLAAAAGTGVVYLLSWHLFANRAAATLTGLLYCSMLLIAAGAIIVTPDMPLVFFWSIALYALAQIYRGNDARWWLVVDIAMGLALQSKYTALLLGAGIPCAMLTVPRMRVWWRRPEPYLTESWPLPYFFRSSSGIIATIGHRSLSNSAEPMSMVSASATLPSLPRARSGC
jgi:4-amino-4-deoxy-L-arabinose transferase-like glycosyltransferase